MAKRYDIVIPKKYDKNGEEKTAWKNVGTLVRFPATEDKPEGYILELNMFPDTTFKVFEQKPKEEKKEPTSTDAAFGAAFPPEVNPDDIPF
jgi:hypothetical protein